jgi:hypothetical protein
MASDKGTLSAILAARKAQMSTSLHTELVGLRSGQDVDSDDDDYDDDFAGASASQPKAALGQAAELLLGRAPNLLSSSSVEERKRTVAALEAAALSADQLKPLLRPLLLRFSDDSERVRDGAAGLFRRWQQTAETSDVSGALPFLMPVLTERLGTEGVREPSEEVRASLVGLLRDVLVQCRQLIRPYTAEVGAIALGCSHDTHPEVIKALCDLLATVASAILHPLCKERTPKDVKPFSTKLLEAVLPHIRHRHAAVRLQVLGALEELLLCGAGQSVETLVGWRLKNNVPIQEFYGKGTPRINYLADVSRDRSVAVRRKLVQVAARWCREMDGEDLYEQEVRLVPYIVSGLCDDDEQTATSARLELERLGEMHLEKNASEYKERIEYGHQDELAATRAITLPTPSPLPCRPPLGARERVRQHFRSLIHPICAELDLWTSTERLQSARLLEVLLAYTEGFVTEFAHQLLPALAKGMDDETEGLSEVVGRCAAQFAQHTQPEEYMPLLVSHAGSDPLNPLSQRMQYLRLLPRLLAGMRPAAAGRALLAAAPLLADSGLVCTQHTPLRAAVRAALHTAIERAAALGATAELKAAIEPVYPLLLFACAAHFGSATELQPRVTALAEGIEDIADADETVWCATLEVVDELVRPLSALVCEGGHTVWVEWAHDLKARLVADADAEEEHVDGTRKLLERILGGVGGIGAAVELGGRGCRTGGGGGSGDGGGGGGAARAAAAPAASTAEPRRTLAIAEVDDLSDDEDPFEDELD